VREACVEVVLLNVMGSAAVATAVIVGVMTTRLSREMAGTTGRQPEKPDQGEADS
jgi:hypothetical protein